jgi:hypothetical protein
MVRALVICIVIFATCDLALAQQGDGVTDFPTIANWAITFGGTFLAARWASDAFNRPSRPVADQPTFPEYMTSTTLADLFTPLLRVDPASAVRTSPRD